MYEDILLPTDGSSGTVEALEHALAIGSDNDARLHSLYVIDKRHYMAAADETKEEVKRSIEEEAERAIDDARVRIEDAGIECISDIREGIPHKTICEYAEAEGIDLIVMGTHGKTGPEQIATLGSTTERVVKNSDSPVLVIEIG